jgi:hypothetical protein
LAQCTFSLPEAFVFYPAQTWPHKNQSVLLEALAFLRDRHGLEVPLACSGSIDINNDSNCGLSSALTPYTS